PGLDAAMAIDALFQLRIIDQIVDRVVAGRVGLAFDRDLPGRGLHQKGLVRRIALVGAELVEIAVAGEGVLDRRRVRDRIGCLGGGELGAGRRMRARAGGSGDGPLRLGTCGQGAEDRTGAEDAAGGDQSAPVHEHLLRRDLLTEVLIVRIAAELQLHLAGSSLCPWWSYAQDRGFDHKDRPASRLWEAPPLAFRNGAFLELPAVLPVMLACVRRDSGERPMRKGILVLAAAGWAVSCSGLPQGAADQGVTTGRALAQVACPHRIAESYAWVNHMPGTSRA